MKQRSTYRYTTDGCDVIDADGNIYQRRQSPLHAAEQAAYLNWREWIDHPPFPAAGFEVEDASGESAAHAAWINALNALNSASPSR